MPLPENIAAFIETLTRHDGFAPFSDAKLPIDPDFGRAVLVAEDDNVIAIGAVASHAQSDRSVHKELETAVRPGMRFPAFEGAVLDASLPLVEGSDSYSIWSRRPSLDSVLDQRGFVVSRVLDYLVVDLPLVSLPEPSSEHRIRTFLPGDVEGMVAVNQAAFKGHREAAALDAADMFEYRSQAMFDDEGVFIAESGGIAGFCWTKVHPDGDGEIFRIAVDPAHQGTGLGVALLHAGFSYLTARSDVRRGALWVDRSNTSAVSLYLSVGMELERSNSEFTRE
ncbi:MAG: GNAT family N-acetyltransferase [Actinomycetota bacterium]